MGGFFPNIKHKLCLFFFLLAVSHDAFLCKYIMCKICQFIAANPNHLLSLMGNHQKLRMGIKVNAEVYSCHGHISDGKSDEGLGAALTFLCWTEKKIHTLPAVSLMLTVQSFN